MNRTSAHAKAPTAPRAPGAINNSNAEAPTIKNILARRFMLKAPAHNS
jgi:hypothetical protein